jgi:DNA-binding winged helix-turn-helix (wHTH) protein
VPETSSSASERLAPGGRIVAWGIVAIVAILGAAAATLFLSLPDANAFNARVERLFLESDLRAQAEVRLLEILAQSGTSFQEVLTSYRMVIFVLLVFSTAMMIAALVFLVTIVAQNRRIGAIQRAGIQVSSMLISREARAVYLNDLEFQLTEAAIETLSVLAEARLDDEVLTGAQIEAVISGRNAADCDEAAGATRVKRLRDALGNQLVTELLVKTVARRGYMLAVPKDSIRMV